MMYTGERSGMIDEEVGVDGLEGLEMPWEVAIGSRWGLDSGLFFWSFVTCFFFAGLASFFVSLSNLTFSIRYPERNMFSLGNPGRRFG